MNGHRAEIACAIRAVGVQPIQNILVSFFFSIDGTVFPWGAFLRMAWIYPMDMSATAFEGFAVDLLGNFDSLLFSCC